MSVKDYVTKQIDTAKRSMDLLDTSEIERFISAIMSHKGSVFFVGVGKNGHVASKAASTFNSIGLKVININPVDAVHGDLGMISDDDLVVAISKSGCTEELVCFLGHCSKRTSNIWLIHSRKNNDSLKYSNHQIFLDIDCEADHLNIVPTSSIVAYCTLMQAVACEIAMRKGIDLKQFVRNHPGGSIGKLETE